MKLRQTYSKFRSNLQQMTKIRRVKRQGTANHSERRKYSGMEVKVQQNTVQKRYDKISGGRSACCVVVVVVCAGLVCCCFALLSVIFWLILNKTEFCV